MPRGRKKVEPQTIEERIAAVTTEIESLQEQIKAKKSELKQLTEEKKAADAQMILNAVNASGKSLEEVLEFLSSEGTV